LSKFKTAVKAKAAQARASQTPALTLAKIIKSETFGKETDSIRAELTAILLSGDPIFVNAIQARDLILGKGVDHDTVKRIYQHAGRTYFRSDKQNQRIADVKAGKFIPHSTEPVVRKAKKVAVPVVKTTTLTSIDDVTLSTRARNVLDAWEIVTVQEAKARIEELKGAKGCGPATIKEIAAL